MPAPLREMSRKAAIVGIGETDYPLDYKSARSPGHVPRSLESMAITAFERALADSGLKREQIDALYVSFTYGGPDPQSMAQLLGLTPRYAVSNGNIMAGPLPIVCADIAAARAGTVAMIYSVASRAIGRQYGGNTYGGGQVQSTPSSYYYYHPWGWSSQAAHWAMMFTYYQKQFGAHEEDLGAVAVQVRRNAIANPNAVMQTRLSIDDYMASRYIETGMPVRVEFIACEDSAGRFSLPVFAASEAAR